MNYTYFYIGLYRYIWSDEEMHILTIYAVEFEPLSRLKKARCGEDGDTKNVVVLDLCFSHLEYSDFQVWSRN